MGTTDFQPSMNSTFLDRSLKIITRDYVGDSYPETKFGANRPGGLLSE